MNDPEVPAVKLSSYHTDPEPGWTHHSASFPLPFNRGFWLIDLAAAAAAFAEADVPPDASIQVNYGTAIMAFWRREDGI